MNFQSAAAPLFLASVVSAEEASLAAKSGAAIIDCKDPRNGALGALSRTEIMSIQKTVGGRLPVSATIGDLPCDAHVQVNAAIATASLGVDIVKVGFFGGGDAGAAIDALGEAPLGQARLVAVLMADCEVDLTIVPRLAVAGFLGVMLDTADKSAGSLTGLRDRKFLAAFIASAKAHGLLAGLAGSLRRQDIAPLIELRPDILGFRGALCTGGRTGVFDAARTAEIARDMSAARRINRAAAATPA